MNILISFSKLIIGTIILLGISIGAYNLGDLFFQYIGVKESVVITKWVIGLCLEALLFMFFFIAYTIGDRLLD